jgi:putative Mg2+ transporter-C (MgtC) family protein
MQSFGGELLDILPRVAAALACGVSVGINRDLHRKPAGFRTFGLVALGSAIVTIAAQRLAPGDPAAASRVAQGILTGIGFLGAGLIVRRERSHNVSGLTTAAAVWATAGLGVACGLGLYALALAGMAAALFVLVVGGPLERRLELLLGAQQASRQSAEQAARGAAVAGQGTVPPASPQGPAPPRSPGEQ